MMTGTAPTALSKAVILQVHVQCIMQETLVSNFSQLHLKSRWPPIVCFLLELCKQSFLYCGAKYSSLYIVINVIVT